MSALTAWQGLEARLPNDRRHTGNSAGRTDRIENSPMIYTVYQSFDWPLRNSPPARNVTGMHHVFTSRLVIRWVENSQAEMQLLTLLDSIPDASTPIRN